MGWLLIFVFILSFSVTFISLPYWIRKAKRAGLVGKDMHKPGDVQIPEMGGICVVLGFLIGVLFYVAIRTFRFQTEVESIKIMAAAFTIALVAIVGVMDDVLGRKIGLTKWQKPLLTLFAAIPMIVVVSGPSIIHIPFIGALELGILYSILLVPIAIVGAANGFNMVGGYNGLEAGLGAIMLFFLGMVAYNTGSAWVSMIAFSMLSAIIAFLWFNKHPARIFPGNTFTYVVGATIACVAILGNMEKIALFMFIPFFIQFALKAKGKMRKESFSEVLEDNSLTRKYHKAYGIEHLAGAMVSKIKGKVFEKDIVMLLLGVQLVLGISVMFFVV